MRRMGQLFRSSSLEASCISSQGFSQLTITLVGSYQSLVVDDNKPCFFHFDITGLKDLIGEDDQSPSRFRYLDGDMNKTFFELPGEFPWGELQPDNLGGNENCVE